MKTKIKPNVVADAIILFGLVAGCVFMPSVADNNSNDVVTDREEVSVKNLTTTTTVVEQEKYSVPSGNTSFKSYMDYRAITDTKSPQYKLQQDCVTDSHGLRRYRNDYVIAVGTYYADYVGERLRVTLEDGKEFTAVVGDFKADSDTDSTNRYTAMNNGGKNVLEFVVDTASLDKTARKMGDISYIDGFDGDVVSICVCDDADTQEV